MLDKKSDFSRTVDKLFSKELLSRTKSPEDRRQKAVGFTQKGIDFLANMDGCDPWLIHF